MLGVEYAGADFRDARLTGRLKKLQERLARAPQQSLPHVCLTEADLVAAYRFLNNEKVTIEQLLAPHQRATRDRARQLARALMLHDSTEFRFGGSTRGDLELSGDHETQSCSGHLSLCAMSGADAPVGSWKDGIDLLGQNRTCPPPLFKRPLGLVRFVPFLNPSRPANAPHGPKAQRQRRKARQKEERLSRRWWEGVRDTQVAMGDVTQLIHVMDREADDYDLFARMLGDGFSFIVRGNHDRVTTAVLKQASKKRTPKRRRLSAQLIEVPAIASRKIELSARARKKRPGAEKKHPTRPARVACIELGATRVILARTPDTDKALPKTIELNCVFVREVAPPPDMEPVDWRLWTSEPIDTPEQILRVVDDYRTRWLIEEYIKALKSGCRVQDRQLESRDALMRNVALMAPIAWHMMYLRELARTESSVPATDLFSPAVLEVLRQTPMRYPLPDNPTAQHALQTIAGMGGHLKRNGPPGFLILARGYQELRLLVQGYDLRDDRQGTPTDPGVPAG